MARLPEYPRTGIIVRVRRVPAADEKPLHWVGSSKRDFLSFPVAVKEDMGNALGIAQFGGTPDRETVEGASFGRAGNREVTRRERVPRGVHGEVRESRVRAPRVPEEVSLGYPNCGAGR